MQNYRNFLLACFIALNQFVFAQQIRETPIGKLATELIAAVNTGKEEQQLAFIKSHFDLNGPQRMSVDEWQKKCMDLFDQSAGVEIQNMKPGRDPDEIQITLQYKKDYSTVEMLTHLSRGSSDQIIGFILLPTTAKLSWPQSKLSESEIIKEIERHAELQSSEDKFSGTLLIAKNDRVIMNKAYGFSNKEQRIANNNETKFNIGSMNKMFTSVAIAQLVQAGKISFSDTLFKILPNYPNKVVAKKITLHQLLTHTAGLGDFFKPEFYHNRQKYVSLESYLPLYADDPLLFEPGSDWAYSNAGFLLLGLVIEKVSGENYFDYVRQHICIPAGMNQTNFYKVDAAIPNLAIGYAFDDSDAQHKLPRHDNSTTLPIMGSSAGGGYSTAGDLLLFSKALKNNILLNPQLTKIITTGKVDDHRPGSQYAYGFMDLNRNGKHMIGHGGGGPGISAFLNMLQDNGYTVIALGNYSAPSADVLALEISEFLIQQ